MRGAFRSVFSLFARKKKERSLARGSSSFHFVCACSLKLQTKTSNNPGLLSQSVIPSEAASVLPWLDPSEITTNPFFPKSPLSNKLR